MQAHFFANFADMATVFLIGYMGSGKTTLGRAVAKRAGIDFIDLDDYIEQRERLTIRQIFAEHGEEAFRAIERAALMEVSNHRESDVIVACGGGTPCFGDNMDLLRQHGLTVYLCAPHHSLLSRLKEGRAKRPLIASLSDAQLDEFIKKQMEWREPFYQKAKITFDSSRLENEQEVTESVDAFLSTVQLQSTGKTQDK